MARLMLTRDGASVRSNRLVFIGGLGVGSLLTYAAAYFGDRRLGRRRRAMLTAKAEHLARVSGRRLGRSRRGVVNHARGWLARLRTRLRSEPVADEVIEERVRAALGRATSHVSLIGVAVRDGCVILGGPILQRERRRVLRTTRRVSGVRAVDDRLEVHSRPDIPQLQDGRPRSRRSTSPRLCADMMKTDVQFVREGDPLRLAAEIMSAANVGFLPVCDQRGKVIGTVTDRDIVVRAVARGSDPELRRVEDIMSPSIVACAPDDELALAEQFMADYQVSRLVVTDEEGILQGVISLSDIAEVEPPRRTARTLRSIAAREAPHPTH